MSLRVALVQLNSGDDPAENLAVTQKLILEAADHGAEFVLTPEVTNIVSTHRSRQKEFLRCEEEDQTLTALTKLAVQEEIWLMIGSLALKSHDPDGRFINRSFLISPTGLIVARYDKIHMSDVAVSETETYRESAGYRPGEMAVLAVSEIANFGMTICYDLRFPKLFNSLACAGASVITVPSAFSPVTGAAHWHSLLRARAIETGCFILAPAQTGTHFSSVGRARSTYGHSLIVDPWGTVLLDAGTKSGAYLVDIDLARVKEARKRIPSLTHDREYQVVKYAQ